MLILQLLSCFLLSISNIHAYRATRSYPIRKLHSEFANVGCLFWRYSEIHSKVQLQIRETLLLDLLNLNFILNRVISVRIVIIRQKSSNLAIFIINDEI